MGKLSTHEFAIGGPSFDLPWPPARNPVEHRPSSRRLVVGLGLGRRRRPVPDGAGHRHRRQRAQSGELLRHRRAEADLRPGVAARRLSAVVHARPCRADDAHRRRQRADAARRSPATIRSIPAAPPSTAGHYAASLDRGVRGLRIGFVRHFHEIDMPADPEVTAGAGACRAHLADGGRRGPRHPSADPRRVRRGQPRHPAKRGLGDPRSVAARAAGRLRPAGAPPPDGRRVHERRRLCPGAAPRGWR